LASEVNIGKKNTRKRRKKTLRKGKPKEPKKHKQKPPQKPNNKNPHPNKNPTSGHSEKLRKNESKSYSKKKIEKREKVSYGASKGGLHAGKEGVAPLLTWREKGPLKTWKKNAPKKRVAKIVRRGGEKELKRGRGGEGD